MSSHRGDDHDYDGHHHDRAALGPARLEEIDQGVYAWIQPDGTWWINNCGLIAASNGLIAIDTCATERRTRSFLDAAAGVSPRPIRILVNTHHHGDHTHGNWLTHPATIVGHRNCRELMLATGIHHYDGVFEPVEWGELHVAPPILTFEDRIELWADDTLIELHHIGTPAHTTNDVVAWVPERRILFTGDLVFNGGTPFVPMGSVEGSLEALERIRALDPEVIVPGHGPPCAVDALDIIERYLRFVLELAAQLDHDGIAPLEGARSIHLGEFATLTDPERIVGNLHRALFERHGAPRGAPMDVAAAIGDMLQYNGGRPLRCLA